jgi:hypothetical protein
MNVSIPRAAPPRPSTGTLSNVNLAMGLAELSRLEAEVDYMWDVLVGRKDAPRLPQSPFLALQEIAVAFLARALEIDALIHRGLRNKEIASKSPIDNFRLHDLANLIVLCRKAADLGSRRLTEASMLHDARRSSSI